MANRQGNPRKPVVRQPRMSEGVVPRANPMPLKQPKGLLSQPPGRMAVRSEISDQQQWESANRPAMPSQPPTPSGMNRYEFSSGQAMGSNLAGSRSEGFMQPFERPKPSAMMNYNQATQQAWQAQGPNMINPSPGAAAALQPRPGMQTMSPWRQGAQPQLRPGMAPMGQQVMASPQGLGRPIQNLNAPMGSMGRLGQVRRGY